MLHISIIPNFARVFEKRYHSCHCEPFVPQDKFSAVIPGMGIFFQAANWEACYAYSLPMIQAGGCLALR